MTTERVAWHLRGAVVLVALTVSCMTGEGPRIEPGRAAPVRARAGCALVARRCSRCHSLDRVLGARVTTPTQWQAYVRRMRLLPSSGIHPSEVDPMVDCLVYRSFGAAGQAALRTEVR